MKTIIGSMANCAKQVGSVLQQNCGNCIQPSVAYFAESTQVLRLRQVIEITGMPRSSIYEAMKRAGFPKSIHLHGRAVGWIKAEVIEWVASRREACHD